MNYQNYQNSRNAAWQILIDTGTCRLPVRITRICNHYGIGVYTYAHGRHLMQKLGLLHRAAETDGFAVRAEGKYLVFFDRTMPDARCRFTIAHELGHVFLGHIPGSEPTAINCEPGPTDDPREQAANVLAARVLAPACVLHAAGLETAEQIAEACDISITAARFRAARLKKLAGRDAEFKGRYGRGCYLLSPLERQVLDQFADYIDEIIN